MRTRHSCETEFLSFGESLPSSLPPYLFSLVPTWGSPRICWYEGRGCPLNFRHLPDRGVFGLIAEQKCLELSPGNLSLVQVECGRYLFVSARHGWSLRFGEMLNTCRCKFRLVFSLQETWHSGPAVLPAVYPPLVFTLGLGSRLVSYLLRDRDPPDLTFETSHLRCLQNGFLAGAFSHGSGGFYCWISIIFWLFARG